MERIVLIRTFPQDKDFFLCDQFSIIVLHNVQNHKVLKESMRTHYHASWVYFSMFLSMFIAWNIHHTEYTLEYSSHRQLSGYLIALEYTFTFNRHDDYMRTMKFSYDALNSMFDGERERERILDLKWISMNLRQPNGNDALREWHKLISSVHVSLAIIKQCVDWTFGQHLIFSLSFPLSFHLRSRTKIRLSRSNPHR